MWLSACNLFSPPPCTMTSNVSLFGKWVVVGQCLKVKQGGDLLGIYMLGPDIDIDIGPTGRDHDTRDRGGAPWLG